MTRRIWLSNKRMTVVVTINSEDWILTASPIVRKFIGSKFINLREWMHKQGGLQVEELKTK